MPECGDVPIFDSRVDQRLLMLKLGRRDAGKLVETPAELVERVSRTLARVELGYGGDGGDVDRWATRFRDLMTTNRFWPSGRILNNCGSRQSQLASCFVLPLEDSFDGIFDTVRVAAQCHRTGGGTGFDLSQLRERGAPIHTAEAAGSSGPVSWLHLFDAATTVVAQGGKMRGANLASLSVHHPDILEFIDAKRGLGRLHNFNLSALVTDAFMHSLATKGEVELVSPVSKRVVGTLPATQIWERISESAWRTGDPGVLFVDRINAVNPLVDHLGPIMTTNPCGEQTLYPYEASNLGSVNLAAFVKDGTVDWAALEETVSCAVRLLDNAIDASVYPDPRVTAMARANRRLGLGVMGYADLLIALGIRYDSGAAMQVIDQLGTVITVAAWSASRALADERGTFPNWEHCRLPSKARNCAITTIAPTGTISMIAGCSSGIEPRFAPSWTKDVMYEGGVSYIDENLVQDLLRCREVSREQAVELVTTTPVCELRLPEAVAAKYRYAHDIAPEWHVRAVARWQRHVDNAVSKTVNLQRTATATEVGAAFELAWRLGCKGLSVYRQGSRERDLQEAAGHHAELEPPRQSRQLVAQGTP